MTKKDFQKIANVLKDTNMPVAIRASLALNFAQVCKADNPRFNIQHFMDACGAVKEPAPKFIRASRALDRDLAKHL